MAPKVFVSHASEDKSRFVDAFAVPLRQEASRPGLIKGDASDSLVHKIFEKGQKDVGAVVVVLSKNSVPKPWVREELTDQSVIKETLRERIG